MLLRSIRPLAAIAVAATAFAAPLAEAADYGRGATLYTPATVGWAGAYVGLAAGYGWGHDSLASSAVEANGGLGGAFAGYNFALGANAYWGVEAGLYAGNMHGTNSVGTAGKLPWMGSLDGRIGYFIGDTSFYILGGFAFGSAELDGISNGLTGWNIGLGGEQRFAGNFFGRAEYRYTDMSTDAATGPTRAISNAIVGGLGMRY